MTTDITELTQSLKAAAEKASGGDWVKESGDGWDAICSNDDQANSGFIIAHFVGPDSASNREFMQLANPANIRALVEALEKALRINGYLHEQSAEWERKAISNFEDCAEMSARIDELESQRKLAFTTSNRWADKFREAEGIIAGLEIESAVKDASNLELKQQYQRLLESHTVTDWIEHDGKWRPDSLSTDELVYLKTRKQELKIPYPAGKVMGWMHTGGDMDVIAYKLALPQASIVTAAAADVLAERQRQVTAEGWAPEHDDEHSNGEMALAASSYALYAHKKPIAPAIPYTWPWESKWFKQQGARRDLVKAAALILAEIERLDRASGIKWEAE